MNLKNKFLLEVIIMILFLSLIPFIWQIFYFNPLKEDYVSSVDKFVSNLVVMPKNTAVVKDSTAYDTTNPDIGSLQKLVFKTNFDEIRYKWLDNNKPIELIVDPNFRQIGNNPLEFRIQLNGTKRAEMINGQYTYNPDTFPTKILKDERAVLAINSFDTQSKIESRAFKEQPDGLRNIQVAFTNNKNYFGVIYWKFDQDKLPFDIGDKAKKIDFMDDKSFTFIFMPNSLSQLLYTTINGGGMAYTTFVLRNVLFPFLIFSFLAYFLSKRIFQKNNLLKVNLVFLALNIILYPLFNFATFYLLILYFSLSGQNFG